MSKNILKEPNGSYEATVVVRLIYSRTKDGKSSYSMTAERGKITGPGADTDVAAFMHGALLCACTQGVKSVFKSAADMDGAVVVESEE